VPKKGVNNVSDTHRWASSLSKVIVIPLNGDFQSVSELRPPTLLNFKYLLVCSQMSMKMVDYSLAYCLR
jgi:hypothetical protein